MVMARLHVICGNCGSNEHMRYTIEKDWIDHDGVNTEDAAVLSCRNCGTIHTLDDTVPRIEQDAPGSMSRHDPDEEQ